MGMEHSAWEGGNPRQGHWPADRCFGQMSPNPLGLTRAAWNAPLHCMSYSKGKVGIHSPAPMCNWLGAIFWGIDSPELLICPACVWQGSSRECLRGQATGEQEEGSGHVGGCGRCQGHLLHCRPTDEEAKTSWLK